MKLSDLSTTQLFERASGAGLCWRVGPFIVRVRTPLRDVVEQIAFLYAGFPLADDESYADHEVSVQPRGLRSQKVSIIADGRVTYPCEPRSIAVPLLEWTLNLCVFHQPSTNLILHAAVVERGGHALILPALPGSGKSTFCAALVHRGWRLLSDEVAILRRDDGRVIPATRPIGLKDASIDVIKQFAPDAVLGPSWPGTPKGTVAHCLPPQESIERADETAQPRWIIFPTFDRGAETQLTPISKPRALVHAAADSFNYSVLGRQGFDALTRLVDACDCYELSYGDLEHAIQAVDQQVRIEPNDPKPQHPSPATVPRITESASSNGKLIPAAIADSPPRIRQLILDAMNKPAQLRERQMAEWDVLLRIARSSNLISSLAVAVEQQGLWDDIPEPVRPHLEAARVVALQHERSALWEVNRVKRALRAIESPVIFLKGAAYLLSGCRFARGRVITDVDLLLPHHKLSLAEQQLQRWGWTIDEKNPLDEVYYRQWLHELPPMVHYSRQTMLDVHHTILPRTDRLNLRPELLFDEAVPFQEDDEQFLVLCPADMLLHAAVHLFRNGDYTKGLRDLADLWGMLTEYSQAEGFWSDLLQRASALDLTGPCFYALRYVERYFEFSIPAEVSQQTQSWQPIWPPVAVMDRLVDAAIFPHTLDGIDRRRKRACSILSRLYLPRFRVAASPAFWKKRFPGLFSPRAANDAGI